MIERNIIWLCYYLIGTGVALMTVYGTDGKHHTRVGVLFTITFAMLAFSHVGFMEAWEYAIMTMATGYVYFLFVTTRSKTLGLIEKVFFLVLPSATFAIYFLKVFHLVYYGEITALSILALATVIIYALVVIYVRKTYSAHREQFEVNGLFAVILVPELI